MAIIEFIIELISATGKAMGIPGWASKDNPILKLPVYLNILLQY